MVDLLSKLTLEQPRIFVIQKKPGFFPTEISTGWKFGQKFLIFAESSRTPKLIQIVVFSGWAANIFSTPKMKRNPPIMQVLESGHVLFPLEKVWFSRWRILFWGEANLLKSEKFMSRWSWPKNTSPKKPLQFWWTSKNPNLHIYYKKIDRKRTYKFVAHPWCCVFLCFLIFQKSKQITSGFFSRFSDRAFQGWYSSQAPFSAS